MPLAILKLRVIPHPYSFKNFDIQAKIDETYANVAIHKRAPPGIVKAEGIIPKVREYAYKLREYALAMKIALERPDLVASNHIVYKAYNNRLL